MTLEDDIREVFKAEIEAADSMKDVMMDNDESEIEEKTIEEAEGLLENVETLNRTRVVFATTLQIGQAIGSEELAEYGARGLEELNDA